MDKRYRKFWCAVLTVKSGGCVPKVTSLTRKSLTQSGFFAQEWFKLLAIFRQSQPRKAGEWEQSR